MSTLAIKILGMPEAHRDTLLAAELLPYLDPGKSENHLLQASSINEVSVYPGHHLIRLSTFRGPLRSYSVLVPDVIETMVELGVKPEDMLVPLSSPNSSGLGPPDSLRWEFLQITRDHWGNRQTEPYYPVRKVRPGDWREPGTRNVIIRIGDSQPSSALILKCTGLNVPSKLIVLPPRAEILLTLYGHTSETAIQRRGMEYDPLGIRIILPPDGEAIQRYLEAGDLVSSGVVANKVIKTLSEVLPEEANLAGVLSCGYYCLLAGKFPDPWDSYQHLLEFFDKLSDISADAAVIVGWHWLTCGKEWGKERASEYLQKAANMLSPPIFSRGLKLLYDGLRLISGNDEATNKIERIAASADWSQTLTTFYGHSLDAPNPEWVYEF